MPDYGRFCPVSLGTEVLADRWTPLIVRELVLGNTRFNDIARCLPGISRSLLVQRLKHLERKGVIETWPSPTGRGHEYHLTPAGKDLEGVIHALGRWAIEWLFDDLHPHEIDPQTLMWWMHRRMDPSTFPEHRVVVALGRWAVHWLYDDLRPHEVDPVNLMWWMHRRIAADRLPPGRVVVQFDHTSPQRVSIWMVLDRGEASVCVQHPGFDVDVVVTATTAALALVFQGYETWAQAVDAGSIAVEGTPSLVRALPRWFLWSPWAQQTRAKALAAGAGATGS